MEPRLIVMFLVTLLIVPSQIKTCTDIQNDSDHLTCELHNANLRISRLENFLEEAIQSLNSKVLRIEEHKKAIDELNFKIQKLQDTLLSIKGDSSHTDERLTVLEEEVRLLWDASRKNNFELHILESKAEEAEKKLKVLTSKVEKTADIVTEQWIQIQQFEQALQASEMKAHMLVRYTRCTFMKFINGLYENYIQKITKILEPYLFRKKSFTSSYASQALYQIKNILSAIKQYHHELQGLIRQKLETNEFTAAFANEEMVFFVASAIITFPIMGAWMLLTS